MRCLRKILHQGGISVYGAKRECSGVAAGVLNSGDPVDGNCLGGINWSGIPSLS
jgi:hypothetical protein